VLRIRDVYPGSRIADTTTATKEEGKKFVVLPVPHHFVATNITKMKIILFLKWKRKKFEQIFKEL
jgi:hypothetical protein